MLGRTASSHAPCSPRPARASRSAASARASESPHLAASAPNQGSPARICTSSSAGDMLSSDGSALALTFAWRSPRALSTRAADGTRAAAEASGRMIHLMRSRRTIGHGSNMPPASSASHAPTIARADSAGAPASMNWRARSTAACAIDAAAARASSRSSVPTTPANAIIAHSRSVAASHWPVRASRRLSASRRRCSARHGSGSTVTAAWSTFQRHAGASAAPSRASSGETDSSSAAAPSLGVHARVPANSRIVRGARVGNPSRSALTHVGKGTPA